MPPLVLSPSIKQKKNGHSLVSRSVEGTATATKVLKIKVMEEIKGKYAIYLEVNCVSKARRLHDLWAA